MVDIIVSESYDPNYIPPPSTFEYKKVGNWNKDRGKTRTYVNKTGHPVTVELGNQDFLKEIIKQE